MTGLHGLLIGVLAVSAVGSATPNPDWAILHELPASRCIRFDGVRIENGRAEVPEARIVFETSLCGENDQDYCVSGRLTFSHTVQTTTIYLVRHENNAVRQERVITQQTARNTFRTPQYRSRVDYNVRKPDVRSDLLRQVDRFLESLPHDGC